MSAGSLFAFYLAAVLAILVILAALGAAMVISQRRYLALHRDYAKKLIAAHEEERAYVAREVHDDALQRVAMIQHDMNECSSDHFDASQMRQRSRAAVEELADLAVMLRRTAHRLHPAIIDQGGLLPALSQLADDSSRMSDVRFSAELPSGDVSLDREGSLILFRIAQEAVRNVIKHAHATSCRIEVTHDDQRNRLIMTVSDDGRGFDPAGRTGASGLGLISMQERARLVDADYAMVSSPGAGTRVRVSVPLVS